MNSKIKPPKCREVFPQGNTIFFSKSIQLSVCCNASLKLLQHEVILQKTLALLKYKVFFIVQKSLHIEAHVLRENMERLL